MKKTNMDLTFEGERTKQTKEKERRLRKKERGREEMPKKKNQKMYVYVSHILVSSTQKMLGNVISK